MSDESLRAFEFEGEKKRRSRKFVGNLASRADVDQSYFTNIETRFSQTVSYKQRHRPVFQMYCDFIFATFMMAVTVCQQSLQYREALSNGDDALMFGTESGAIYKIIIDLVLLGRFFTAAFWYRKYAKGNLPEQTATCFAIRIVYDMLLTYPVCLYFLKPVKQIHVETYFMFVLILNVSLTVFLIFAGFLRAKKKLKLASIETALLDNSNRLH